MTSALFLSSATTRTTGVSRSPPPAPPDPPRGARLAARVGVAGRPVAPTPDTATPPGPASGNGWGCAPAAGDAPPKAGVLGRASEDPLPSPAPAPPPARPPTAAIVEPGTVCTTRPPPPEDSTSFKTAARSVALLFWT